MNRGPECRWCRERTDAEFVDVGVGLGGVQVTGGICDNCGGVEMGPYLVGGLISEEEMATKWHGPFEDHADYSPFNPESLIIIAGLV